MKKTALFLLALLAFASNASAHHMARSDMAGIYIDEESPHLLMEF